MKTNKILMAVALPALLAACTAEEIVEQSATGNVSGRAMLDSNFAVKVEGNVESRFSWDSYKWGWTEDDSFGAAVVDPVTPWTASNQYMLGNYIHSQNAAGNWVTDSQMSEGIYMFYSYDGYKLKGDRGLVTFDITSQKADLDDPEALMNDAKNQLFFSPLYNLEAKYSTEVLPLEFRSFWGVAAFNFKNATEQTLKITQIILKEKDSSNKFIVKGGINPAALQGKLQYVYNEDEEAYIPTQVDKVLKTAGHTAKQVTKAYEEFAANMLSLNASIAPEKTGVKSSFIALDCQEYELEDGEEVTAYMLVPAHDGKNLEVDIMVVDEDGEAKVVHVNNNKVSDIKTLDILRDKTNAIFGKTTAGAIKTLKIVEKDLKDDAGFYVSDNEGLLELLDGNHGALTIHNSGDVVIDEEVSEAIREYIGTSVTFTQPIAIAASTALVDDEDVELALDGVIFEGDVTVKGADEDKNIDGEVEFLNCEVKATLIVEEGAKVTLKHGSYENVKSYGDLTIVGDPEDTAVSRNVEEIDGVVTIKAGTLKVKGCDPQIVMEAGELSYEAEKVGSKYVPFEVTTSQLEVLAGANVTIGKYVTMYVDEAETINYVLNEAETVVNATSTWTNNGTIVLDKDLTVYGTLNNNNMIKGDAALNIANFAKKVIPSVGSAYYVAVGSSLINAEGAEIKNKTITIAEKSYVENGGEIAETSTKALTNNGTIKMTDFDARVTITAGDKKDGKFIGQVDNTEKGVVNAPAGMRIYANMPAMTNLEEIAKYGASTNVNKLVITGKWTVTKDEDWTISKVNTLNDSNFEIDIKEIEFKGGDLSIDEKITLDLDAVDVIINADTEWKGRSQKTSKVIDVKSVTIEKDANLVPYDFDVKTLNLDVTSAVSNTKTLYGDYHVAESTELTGVTTINANGHALILATKDFDLAGKTIKNAIMASEVELKTDDNASVVKLTSGETVFENCSFEAPTTRYDIHLVSGTLTLKNCDFLTATDGVTVTQNKGTANEKVVEAGKRAIYVTGSSATTLNVEGCEFDDKVYAFNSSNENLTANFKDCALNGWLSGEGTFTYDECTFGASGKYANLVPYGRQYFNGCTFEEGFKISVRATVYDNWLILDKRNYYGETLVDGAEDLKYDLSGDANSATGNQNTTWNVKVNGVNDEVKAAWTVDANGDDKNVVIKVNGEEI